MTKNFARKTPLYFGEAFEIPKDFSRKVLWSGFGAYAPTFSAYTKNAALPRFFNCRQQLELRSKPCFKRLLKKPLKNPQNFRSKTPLYFGEAFEDFKETFPEKFL